MHEFQAKCYNNNAVSAANHQESLCSIPMNSKAKIKDNREIFEKMPVWNALQKMCVPTIIGQMVILIYNLADTFFIGQTGNPYMVAATSLILPVFNLSNAMSNFVGIGGGSLISRLLGARKEEEARKVSSFSFYLGLLVSAAYSLLIFLACDPLLLLLGASENTFAYAKQYVTMVTIVGGIPTILQLTLAQLLRAVGCSKEAGFGISMGGLLNIALDPLFMFVILPDGHEVIGAGIATMLSNTFSFLYFLVVVIRLRQRTVLTLSPKAGLPSQENVRSVFLGGIPAGTSNLLFDFSQIMINRLMSGHGDISLAAIGIVLKAERIPLNAGIGICQGMMPIVAYNYSARNLKRLRETVSKSRLAGLLVAAAAIVFYELCAGGILHLFIRNTETQVLGAAFLRARCIATPFMFMCFHILYAFQGMGKAGIASMLAVLRQLVLYVPMLILMDRIFGMYGLVWTQFASDFIMMIISVIVYERFLGKQTAD